MEKFSVTVRGTEQHLEANLMEGRKNDNEEQKACAVFPLSLKKKKKTPGLPSSSTQLTHRNCGGVSSAG